jgi:hypothetical protein
MRNPDFALIAGRRCASTAVAGALAATAFIGALSVTAAASPADTGWSDQSPGTSCVATADAAQHWIDATGQPPCATVGSPS